MLPRAQPSTPMIERILLYILTILNLSFLHTITQQYTLTSQVLDPGPQPGTLLRHLPIEQVALRYRANGMPITNEEAWAGLIPANGGVVRGNETTSGDKGGQGYVVGMYQQLRCLDELRVAYLAAHNRSGENEGRRKPNATAARICLGQLWQIIQCNADTTLDPGVLVDMNGTLVPASSGTEVVHRCNDWTRVRDAMERGSGAAS